jgi:hypothetical protein
MLVTGLSLFDFRSIVGQVSAEHYEGNVIVHQDAHKLSETRFRARLTVKDSRAHGARLSWSGRHIPAASWEAYRDVLAEVFERYPSARVRTAMATYAGKDGFEANYPATAYVNVGSQMQPAYMGELSL